MGENRKTRSPQSMLKQRLEARGVSIMADDMQLEKIDWATTI